MPLQVRSMMTVFMCQLCCVVSADAADILSSSVPQDITEPLELLITKSYDNDAALRAPSAVGQVFHIAGEELSRLQADKVEDVLQQQGLAVISAGSGLGIGSGASIRGYAVSTNTNAPIATSKVFINNVPDVGNGIARDSSTIESITITNGTDATFMGSGAPGGGVTYQTKRPQGITSSVIDIGAATDHHLQFSVDMERHVSDVLQTRTVLAVQHGGRTVEQQITDKETALISTKLTTDHGNWILDLERQNNHTPFVFGTFYHDGQYWYDRPYASPRQNMADRAATRIGLYWNKSTDDMTDMSAWLQNGRVNRHETLVGYWTAKDDQTLDGYYRKIDSLSEQWDAGLQLNKTIVSHSIKHQVVFRATNQTHRVHFNGPQSFGEFTIDIAQPHWPVDVSAIVLTPRMFGEHLTERGIALSDNMQVTPLLDVNVGVRQSYVAIEKSNSASNPAAVTDMTHQTYSTGMSYQYAPHTRLWLSRAESFEPSQGQTIRHEFLPPTTAVQWDVGIEGQHGINKWSVSVFDIRQKNIPASDPDDDDFYVPNGNSKSQGINMHVKQSWHSVDVNTTLQNVKKQDGLDASSGNTFAGTPRYMGGIKISQHVTTGFSAWVNPFWVGRRPANDVASIDAAGYLLMNTGVVYHHKHWQFIARLDNVLDQRYVQALNDPENVWQGARRQLFIGGKYDF